MASEKRSRICFRMSIEEKTTEGEVYRYLLSNPNWELKHGKAMLNQSARDYWLANARQFTDADLAKTTALACVERLEYRIAQIRQDFGLEPPDRARSEQSELIKLLVQLIAEVKVIPQSLVAISTAISGGAGGATFQPTPVLSKVPVDELTGSAESEEDLYSSEDIAAVLEMIGPMAENLEADPND